MNMSLRELRSAIGSSTRMTLPLIFPLFLLACATPRGTTPSGASDTREEIYVLRSITEQQTSNTEWCSQDRTGFAPLPTNADRVFSLWAVQTQASDGRVVSAKSNRAADGHVCFGPTPDRSVLNFYAEGKIGDTPYIGAGDCRVVAVDSPEKGLILLRCVLTLRGLPAPYVGGMLVTNTIASKAALGGETDPPGYTQTSIATVRLWKSK